VPRLLRATWDLTGHGFGRGWLLLALLLVALLVDARHLRGGEPRSSGQPPEGAAPTISDDPGLTADRWTARLTGWRPHGSQTTALSSTRALGAAAALAASCTLLAYTLRDIVVLVASHARQPHESRRAALAHGRLALCELRQQRADAIAAATPPDTSRRRKATRGLALLGVGFLLAAALLLAPVLAS
jgi:hypothetical protein